MADNIYDTLPADAPATNGNVYDSLPTSATVPAAAALQPKPSSLPTLEELQNPNLTSQLKTPADVYGQAYGIVNKYEKFRGASPQQQADLDAQKQEEINDLQSRASKAGLKFDPDILKSDSEILSKKIQDAKLTPDEMAAFVGKPAAKFLTPFENATADVAGGLANPENVLYAPLAEGRVATALARPIAAAFTAQGAVNTAKGIADKNPEEILAGAASTALPALGLKAKIPEQPSTIGEDYASRKQSTEQVPQLEVRPQVGEEAPLQQQPEKPAQESPPQRNAPRQQASGVLTPSGDEAGRLAELTRKTDRTPEEEAERKALQAKSDAVKNSAGWGDLKKTAAAAKAVTAPEPDSRVVVQAPSGDVPGYVQIAPELKAGQTEAIGAKTPEQLRAAGHDVPDLSKLPQGRYAYQEAQMLSNIGKDAGFEPYGRVIANGKGWMDFKFSNLPEGNPLKDANFTVPFDPKVGVTREAIVQKVREAADRFKQSAEPPTPPVATGQKEPPLIQAVKEQFPRNPIDRGEAIIGNAAVKLADRGNGKVELVSIRTLDKGKGESSVALKQITDLADKHGTTLTALVKPIGKGGLSKPDLIAWYGRNGFKAVKGDYMERQPPQASPKPTETVATGQTGKQILDEAIERVKKAIKNPDEGEEIKRFTVTPNDSGQWQRWDVTDTKTGKLIRSDSDEKTANDAANKLEQSTPQESARPTEQSELQVESTTPLEPQSGKELVGMGADIHKPRTDFGTAGAPRDIAGIAHRVQSARAEGGRQDMPARGAGVSAPDSIERGRELLAKGSDPEKILQGFNQTKRFSADDVAVVRAHAERLARDTNAAEEKFGSESSEYKNAHNAESQWLDRIKPMQTEWHKAGMAQQGETDIDTGTYSGLQRSYRETTGEDFTPQQTKTAKKLASENQKAQTEEAVSKQKLNDEISKSPDVNDVWKRAKTYLAQGITDFDDLRNKLATDLGMPVDKVTKLLSQNRTVKRAADDAWKKQQQSRRLKDQAKRWVQQTALPGWRRAIDSVPRILFGLKVGFHGTVALGTHAPTVAFQPPFWKTYVTDFGKMYRMVGSPAYYERQIQDLQRRPNYITARRAGLQNDPYQLENFSSPQVAKYFGRLTNMGNRGYSVLKILRQDMFDQHWNNLPDSAKTPEVAKAIADGLNHATGIVKVKAPAGANLALFAPRLEASRAAWLVADPIKAANTILNWKNASEADKAFAIHQIKEKAWVLGTLYSMLALNQGILNATGSKQKINFDNPMKSDFMKFKAAGTDISYGNAMLSMGRLPVRLYQIRQSNGGKLKNLIYPDEDTYTVLGEYGRSQMSPFASLVSTLWLKGDWENRPLPSSQRPVPKRLRAQGVKPYTWPEFWTEQVMPIPAEEAVREVWKDGLGMSPQQVSAMKKAAATIAVMGLTGARMEDDVKYPKTPQTASVQ